MKLVFLGPPGSGKGTQAKQLAQKLGIPHISVGDLLREEVRSSSPIGLRIKAVMEAGNLVPDEVTVELTKQRLQKDDCQKGFILDGFPRNSLQATALEMILEEANFTLDKAVYFDISADLVVARLSGRRSCKNCGAVYHLQFNPSPAEDKCGQCGGELYQRADDQEVSIRKRFEVYAEQTQPLIDYYRKRNKLVTLDASQPIEKVFADLCSLAKDGH